MKKILVFFAAVVVIFYFASSVSAANSITSRLKGKLLLHVQDKGRIWYVDPVGLQKHEVTFANALNLFQTLALGITNADLIKIPADLESISSSLDSDGDGYTDRAELQSGYSPYIAGSNKGRFKTDNNLATKLKGRLLLQVQDKGRIWYIDQNGKRWEVTWGNLMSLFRKLALGITNSDLNQVGATNTADGCGSGHKFISEDLGISFCYPDKYGNNSIAVKQENNKVYVYWAGSSPESGQSVEIFEKDRVDTLKTAIEKHFQLSNYKDCSVDESTTKYNTKNGATTAELSYPFNTTSDGPWFSSGYCPDGYEMTNGIRYFYTTPNSNKFLFFSIGQYSIDLSDGRTWQDTIKLIDSTFKFTDETADWQMYTNSEYGYEIKYPNDLVINQTDSNNVTIGSQVMSYIAIERYPSRQNIDFQSFVQEKLVEDFGSLLDVNKIKWTEWAHKEIFNQYVIDAEFENVAGGYTGNVVWTYFAKGDWVYRISALRGYNNMDQKAFQNQILSTFSARG
ncbi:hypothetical protein A2V95_03400 [Candidatus Kuenenbacteria bacterium RBG_16_41_7]|uniref:EF-hand domain-containing protein n=1 Tax=Candidatus Kuenenbacteria bacterium RBG_16_41_7 TaxID=1798560 RepID=A0A1F6GBZ0_9BACT|nr:MAG: hypothetical protein A2V95_03400 [Candidatus Kuenenbacteria bacterium RBG_16_41_7]